ncbi:Aste57867_16311 [Aphanomyces stellatus]|uniref:Aste57867_16311 protein n=1 Tax=Aphanomyces stellatus TaxID=120398 RepID=A0A485L5B5_9STRA|nr:hypothetical protein As57867_016254 [Aphanomyces stellatus]VFT93087.1 Aste57867_16311 [Aphanomyces stellatus]
MNEVGPCAAATAHARSGSPPRLHQLVGVAYVIVTVGLSIIYMVVLEPFVANDYWWPQFNTSGTQTFLGDLYNTKLATSSTTLSEDRRRGALGRRAPRLRSHCLHVGSRVVGGRIHGHGAGALALAASLGHGCSRAPCQRILRLGTLPLVCWLDLGRRYEMGHTDAHQARCRATREANAAMYLEPMLRNLAPHDLITSTYWPEFHAGVLAAVDDVWTQALLDHSWGSVGDDQDAPTFKTRSKTGTKKGCKTRL